MKTKKTHLRRRPRINKVVKILRNRTQDSQDISRQQILFQVDKIEVCGLEWGLKKIGTKRWYPRCKQKLCPWCQSTSAKADRQILSDQFDEYDGTKRLYFVRLSLGHGNIDGDHLREEIDKLIAVFKKVTNLHEWKDEVLRCGGFLHVEWRPATSTRKAGWWPHIHIICLTRTEKPRLERIAKVIREALGLDGSTSGDHYFNHQRVKHLGRTLSYACSTAKRIPGYPTKKRPAWLLKEIPDPELVLFTAAVKNHQRIYQRGFDIDLLKASRKVGVK
jgi:hypothetical protein